MWVSDNEATATVGDGQHMRITLQIDKSMNETEVLRTEETQGSTRFSVRTGRVDGGPRLSKSLTFQAFFEPC